MMKSIMKYISAVVLAVMMTAGLPSCVYDFIREDVVTDKENITLLILLGILDGPTSRAEAPDIEQMHSIRVVLLDDGGTVEYNDKIVYNDPVIESEFMVIPTVKGEKKIFFIANEESVTLEGENGESLTELIERFPKGSTGFEDAVNDAYFKLDPEKPLPMTSQYTFDAGNPGENNYTFYVVPAATKFTFNITNKRVEESSTITKIAIEKLADANYVMPHVGEQYRNWTNDDGSIDRLYWIYWLKNVVDVTNQNQKVPGNYNTNQRLGWILDYELPEHSVAPNDMFVGSQPVNGVPDNLGNEEPQYETVTFGPYYAPESKTLKNQSNVNGEQTYTLVLELTDGTKEERRLSRDLSFVTALFRNTHVVIDITIEMGYMHIYGEIRSWRDNDVYGMLTEED